jgi:hypothetical protein
MSEHVDLSIAGLANVAIKPTAVAAKGTRAHGGIQGDGGRLKESKEWSLDRTLSETFPCSDPLSSIPNPSSQPL